MDGIATQAGMVRQGGGLSYDSEVSALSPVAYYRFSETSGTSATDETGITGPGIYAGGITLNQTGPFAGATAVDLNGTDARMTMPSGLINGASNFSILVWANPDTLGVSKGYIVALGDYRKRLYIYREGSNYYYQVGSISGVLAASAESSTWAFLVLTGASTGECKFYKDSSLVSATTGHGSTFGNQYNNLGRYYDGATTDAHFDGKASELAIYDKVLTGPEISQIFTAANL